MPYHAGEVVDMNSVFTTEEEEEMKVRFNYGKKAGKKVGKRLIVNIW